MSSPINASTYEMNVNMVEHQRSILSVIGIDLWMPKTDAPTRTYTSGLYRDQAAPEYNHFQDFQVNNLDVSDVVQTEKNQNSHVVTQTIQAREHRLEKSNIERADQQPNLKSGVVISTEVREAVYVAPFELQALSLENCLILVDSTELTQEQATLWHNIQMAKTGQFSALKWPFALTPLQDGRGVQVYIQGFVDALKVDKQILSLGEISHATLNQIVALPSLQEMLDQPQLKRALWNYMQKSQ